MLVRPADGTHLSRPRPCCSGCRRAKANYYNVQLYRNGSKVLSAWPSTNHFACRFGGRSRGIFSTRSRRLSLVRLARLRSAQLAEVRRSHGYEHVCGDGMRVRRHSDLARPLAALVASLLAGAALAASGVAVAGISDSPPTTPSPTTSTSTDPVSTVTLLPPPKTAPSPRPDPFPTQTHKSAPRPTAPPTSKPSPAPAPSGDRPLAPAAAPAAAPTSSTGQAASTKRLRARNTHTTRRHETRKAIKPHSGAATHAPRKRTPVSPATPHPTAATPLGNAAPMETATGSHSARSLPSPSCYSRRYWLPR